MATTFRTEHSSCLTPAPRWWLDRVGLFGAWVSRLDRLPFLAHPFAREPHRKLDKVVGAGSN
jgi:hypothetical protein